MVDVDQVEMQLRAFLAECPGCGAPLQFSSPQTRFVVCGHCQSTLARQTKGLSRIGRSGDDFLGSSVLRVLQRGTHGDQPFQLVGREQFRDEVTWHTDWHLTVAGGNQAQLSETDGGYVWFTLEPRRALLPAFETWTLGATANLKGNTYRVTATRRCRQGGAEGEVARPLLPGNGFGLVELRSPQGRVLRIDYASSPAEIWLGERVDLDELQLEVVVPETHQTEWVGRISCPSCGGRVKVSSAAVLIAKCPSCGKLVDLSGESPQARRASLDGQIHEPMLPLGTIGVLDGKEWQVVGFERREGNNFDGAFAWSEYQLYNPEEGFAFLVDDRNAWRMLRQVVGAPQLSKNRQVALYGEFKYLQANRFTTKALFVAGEFGRRLEAGRETQHQEYRHQAYGYPTLFLCAERTGDEEFWLAGHRIFLEALVHAFPCYRDAVVANPTLCPSCAKSLELVSPLTRTAGCGNCGAMVELPLDGGMPALAGRQTGSYSGTPVLQSWVRLIEDDWHVLGCAILLDEGKNVGFRYNLFGKDGSNGILRESGGNWQVLKPLRNAEVRMGKDSVRLTSEGQVTEYQRSIEKRLMLKYFEGESPECIGLGGSLDTQRFDAIGGESLWRETIADKTTTWWCGRPVDREQAAAVQPHLGFFFEIARFFSKALSGKG